MNHKILIAIALLVGTVIGAGILGIPYVVAKSGFVTGMINIVFIGIAMLFINLYLGEVTLRTEGNHQLVGYAKIYLGGWAKNLMAFSMFFGIYGALIAYTLGEGEVINVVLKTDPVISSLVFFVIAASLVYLGLRTIGKSELIITSLFIVVIILLGIVSFSKINAANLTEFHPKSLLLPYGVVLFAFIGTSAIPQMKEELMKNRKSFKKAIIIGSLIPLVVYILFAFVVVGMIGLNNFESLPQDQRIATIALNLVVGKEFGIFANIFAVLTMGTSFFALGLALKEMFQYDYHFNKNLAWISVCIVPLAFFLTDAFIIDITNFISVLDIAGAVSGGIAGVLIVLMFWKAKKVGRRSPEFSIKKNLVWEYILMVMFILGIVYQFL